MNSSTSNIASPTTPRSLRGTLPAQRPGGTRGYSWLAIGAIAASAALAACGSEDGVAYASTNVAEAGVAAAMPSGDAQPRVREVDDASTVSRVARAIARGEGARFVQTAEHDNHYNDRQVARGRLGRVRAIESLHDRPQGSGAGAVIGGVLGAVVGNQFGSGNGRAAATVLGGVGGAVAGNNVERNRNESVTGYRVEVQFDDGAVHTYHERQLGDLQVGDRVRVRDGALRRV